MAPRGAAFFDLDRTLLQGGTGPLLSQAMRETGLSSRGIPGEKVIYGVFDRLGENLVSIFLARNATLLAKGKQSDAYTETAERAAEAIVERVHPFAPVLIDQHRREGRRVVMATTTPIHLIQPLADLLGFDDVIATKYSVTPQDTFDGGLDGDFVWGPGKLTAVRRYAKANDIDLKHSFAYSDSVYDVPLLNAVGNATAVNPDPRLIAVAKLRRWPIVYFDVSPGAYKIPVLNIEAQRIVTALTRPELYPYAKFDIKGGENIPKTGAGVIVSNHRSNFDVAANVQFMRHTNRTCRVLAKKELFNIPIMGELMRAVGLIEVDRGGKGERATSLDQAALALEHGELVYVLPQGTIPRGEKFFDPVLEGRTGAARLAVDHNAPIIPIGLWGTEKVWPRSSKLPRMHALADPPVVRIRIGEPFFLDPDETPADNTRRILDAVSELLPPEGRKPYTPTEEELRSTYPDGKLPGEK